MKLASTLLACCLFGGLDKIGLGEGVIAALIGLAIFGRPTSRDRIASAPCGVSTSNARPSSEDWIETGRTSAGQSIA